MFCRNRALMAVLLATSFVGPGNSHMAQASSSNVMGGAAQGRWYNPEEGGTNKPMAMRYYQKASQAFQIGDFPSAINLLKEAFSMDPGNKQIVHLLALSYAEHGDTYNAMLQFRAALGLDYNYIECRNNFGLFLRKTGKPFEAQKEFEECIKQNPRYPDAYYHLGEIIKEKGDLDQAIELFQTAVRLNPQYFDALRDLGLALFERYTSGQGGDINESLQKLQEAAQLIPDNPTIHYNLGTVYCSQSLFDRAEASFRRALMCDAKHAAAHYELAKLRYFKGDVDRCIAECKLAQQINPVYTEGQKYPKIDPLKIKELESVCYEVKGLLIEAVEAYKEVASMQRDNSATLKHIAAIEKTLRAGARKRKVAAYDQEEVQALIKKGVSEIDGGDLDSAKRTFQRVLELNPTCFEAIQHTGEILEASGDLNGALQKYQQAMALRPKFDGAYFNLAVVLEKMNLSADAGMMYQRFHEIAGKYPYDPRHIVAIQQEEVRRRAKEEMVRKRGY
ncbi:MAG TPA: tetratricopeptide repeat protein [Candidatus Obscuribacterales bacterium]